MKRNMDQKKTKRKIFIDGFVSFVLLALSLTIIELTEIKFDLEWFKDIDVWFNDFFVNTFVFFLMSTLLSKIKNEYLNLLFTMWNNKAVTELYEPGSTFKLVTTSAALEEGIADTDTAGRFNCSGSITIAGVRIKCWRYYRPHGSQSLRNGLMNSCNPVFIVLF